MKNVVFLNTNKAWGGGEKWHFEMANALSKKDYLCTVICYKNSPLALKCKKHNIPYLEFKNSNLSFLNPISLMKLVTLLNETLAEVAFVNLPIDAKMITMIRPFIRIKKIIYRRGMPNPIKPSLLNRFVFSKIDHLIANSIEIKKSLTKELPHLANKTEIIYNGVSIKPFPIRTIENKEKLTLGNIGRLVEQKGQFHLIELAKNLKMKGIKFELLIAGTGPLKKDLEEMIRKNDLRVEVNLLGHYDNDAFFKKIDLLVFPSYFEGSANAMIESLQYAVPMVAFHISSMPEVISDGSEGFLVTFKNDEMFLNKTLKILQDPTIYQKMSQNCLKRVSELFNYEKKVIEVERLIND